MARLPPIIPRPRTPAQEISRHFSFSLIPASDLCSSRFDIKQTLYTSERAQPTPSSVSCLAARNLATLAYSSQSTEYRSNAPASKGALAHVGFRHKKPSPRYGLRPRHRGRHFRNYGRSRCDRVVLPVCSKTSGTSGESLDLFSARSIEMITFEVLSPIRPRYVNRGS